MKKEFNINKSFNLKLIYFNKKFNKIKNILLKAFTMRLTIKGIRKYLKHNLKKNKSLSFTINKKKLLKLLNT